MLTHEYIEVTQENQENQENSGAGEAEHKAWGGEMLPTQGIGWWASALRGEVAGCIHKVAGMSIVAEGGPR